MTHVSPLATLGNLVGDLFQLRDAWFGEQTTCAMQLFEEAIFQVLESPQRYCTAEDRLFSEAAAHMEKTIIPNSQIGETTGEGKGQKVTHEQSQEVVPDHVADREVVAEGEHHSIATMHPSVAQDHSHPCLMIIQIILTQQQC